MWQSSMLTATPRGLRSLPENIESGGTQFYLVFQQDGKKTHFMF